MDEEETNNYWFAFYCGIRSVIPLLVFSKCDKSIIDSLETQLTDIKKLIKDEAVIEKINCVEKVHKKHMDNFIENIDPKIKDLFTNNKT